MRSYNSPWRLKGTAIFPSLILTCTVNLMAHWYRRFVANTLTVVSTTSSALTTIVPTKQYSQRWCSRPDNFVTRKARIFNWISSELLSGRTTAATVKSDGLSIHQRGSNRPQSSLRQSPFCTTFNRISGLLTRHNNTSARLPLKKIFSLLLHVGGASGLKESWIIQCNLRVWSNLHRVDRLIH